MTDYFASVAQGLEELAAQELVQLGAQAVRTQPRGVAFQGDRELLYRCNLWARIPFRILEQVRQAPCRHADDLYDLVYDLDWSPYLTPEMTFAVEVTGRTERLNHSHFTALQVKNAVIDQQREVWGQRSSVDLQQPDLRIHLHLYREQATLSLDSSGESLHRRGYRTAMGLAPLKENLASGLMRWTGWQADLPLMDPLCGSGTLLLEGSLQALKVAPGLGRGFGFQGWPDYDADLWERLCQQAQLERVDSLGVPVLGRDRQSEVVDQARWNAMECGLTDQLDFRAERLEELEAPAPEGILVCNPPYGERIGRVETLGRFYRLLGDVFKQRFRGWTAYVLSGNRELTQQIGLRSAQRWPVNNGAIPCQWLKYELY